MDCDIPKGAALPEKRLGSGEVVPPWGGFGFGEWALKSGGGGHNPRSYALLFSHLPVFVGWVNSPTKTHQRGRRVDAESSTGTIQKKTFALRIVSVVMLGDIVWKHLGECCPYQSKQIKRLLVEAI